jgi:AcrR family transcriptional regulator
VAPRGLLSEHTVTVPRTPRRPAAIATNGERRSSYGANSPLVGERGTRTRQEIVASALLVFDERGFHDTTVDDIATTANVSRATLYQYFESKEALFAELVEESGAALMKVLSRMGPLDATAAGFANLRAWVDEWSMVFDRYSTVFIQWANVNSPRARLRSQLDRFVESHARRLKKRLASAPIGDQDPEVAAVLLYSVLELGNYMRRVYTPGEPHHDRFVDDLSVAFQWFLFPSTPIAVLAGSVSPPPSGLGRSTAPRQITLPDEHSRTASLRPQGRRTFQRLLEASGEIFAQVGFADASVDQIVSQVGVARGTFYKYFDDKIDVLLAVSEDAVRAIGRLYADAADRPSDALTSWLVDMLTFNQTYWGVMRAWTERLPEHPSMRAMAADCVTMTYEYFNRIWTDIDGYPVLSRWGAFLIWISMLEQFPALCAIVVDDIDGEQIVSTQLRFFTGGLLRGRTP